jgi:hypothetical protein
MYKWVLKTLKLNSQPLFYFHLPSSAIRIQLTSRLPQPPRLQAYLFSPQSSSLCFCLKAARQLLEPSAPSTQCYSPQPQPAARKHNFTHKSNYE